MLSWLFLLNAAFGEVCHFDKFDFEFTATGKRNRAVSISGSNDKVAFPEVPGAMAVNLAPAPSTGSVCSQWAVFPVKAGWVAVVFEVLGENGGSLYATVLDLKEKTFSKPLFLSEGTEISLRPVAGGFALAPFDGAGEEDAITSGKGPAAGLDMLRQQTDLWKTVRLGAKGLELNLDAGLTWENSRWRSYFKARSEFDKAFALASGGGVKVYSGFSREKKKDCLLIRNGESEKYFCKTLTKANLE